MLELVTFSLLNGVVYGLLLFMLSSGLTLIWSMMGVLNFAHASMFMLGAYFSYQLGRTIGFWPALVIAPLVVGALGAAIERYGLRHVHRQGHVGEILFTFGLAYLIAEVVIMVWGRNPIENRVPATIDFPAFEAHKGRNGRLSSHLPWADPRRGWDFVSAGRGDVPWEDCFRALSAIGYDGPVSVEWEDASMDRLHGAPEALAFLKRFDFAPPATAFDAAFDQG